MPVPAECLTRREAVIESLDIMTGVSEIASERDPNFLTPLALLGQSV